VAALSIPPIGRRLALSESTVVGAPAKAVHSFGLGRPSEGDPAREAIAYCPIKPDPSMPRTRRWAVVESFEKIVGRVSPCTVNMKQQSILQMGERH
jgi:hypothetical protein